MSDFVTEARKQFKRRFKVGREVTGEDIRLRLSKNGITPTHSNAWGGLVRSLIRDGLLTPTGFETYAEDPNSRSRRLQVYEVSR